MKKHWPEYAKQVDSVVCTLYELDLYKRKQIRMRSIIHDVLVFVELRPRKIRLDLLIHTLQSVS